VRELALLALLLASCGASAESGWVVEVAMSVSHKLGSCAVGDLDGDKPGNEIAEVGENGDIHLAWREPGGWKQIQIAPLQGEMIQCAIGDADPARPGN